MSLDHGGHLTHGAKVNFSGKLFRAVQYGIRPDNGEIDYDALAAQALAEKPKMIVAGFSAYSRVLDFKTFREIADSVGAYLMVDMAHVAGLVAAGMYPNPMPYADVVTTTTHKTLRGPRGGMILARANDEITKKLNSLVFPGTQGGPLMHVDRGEGRGAARSAAAGVQGIPEAGGRERAGHGRAAQKRGYKIVCGGTDNHLFLLDLSDKAITGKDADAALGKAHITVNKNAVPNDPRPPMVTSGIRIGTPAGTTRGFKEREFEQIADWIADVLDANGSEAAIEKTRAAVAELCRRYPVYGP